jgi:putative ABC transport system substrate-binding protein
MDRRTFLAGTGAVLLAAPLAAEAQRAGKVYRLGVLNVAAPPNSSDRSALPVLLATALRELGYAEGQNLLIERRYAEGQRDRLPGLARELVQLQMDAILSIGDEATHAAKDATKTIPIVMIAGNVVEEGIVASLAKPGGNVTGVVMGEIGLAPKRLQLLKEAIPRATRIAVPPRAQETMRPSCGDREGSVSLGVSPWSSRLGMAIRARIRAHGGRARGRPFAPSSPCSL